MAPEWHCEHGSSASLGFGSTPPLRQTRSQSVKRRQKKKGGQDTKKQGGEEMWLLEVCWVQAHLLNGARHGQLVFTPKHANMDLVVQWRWPASVPKFTEVTGGSTAENKI